MLGFLVAVTALAGGSRSPGPPTPSPLAFPLRLPRSASSRCARSPTRCTAPSRAGRPCCGGPSRRSRTSTSASSRFAWRSATSCRGPSARAVPVPRILARVRAEVPSRPRRRARGVRGGALREARVRLRADLRPLRDGADRLPRHRGAHQHRAGGGALARDRASLRRVPPGGGALGHRDARRARRSLRQPDRAGDPAHARLRLHARRPRPGSGGAPRLERHLRRGPRAATRTRSPARSRARAPSWGGPAAWTRAWRCCARRSRWTRPGRVPARCWASCSCGRAGSRTRPASWTRPRGSISGRPRRGPSSGSCCSGSGGRRKRSSSCATSCGSTAARRARTSASA